MHRLFFIFIFFISGCSQTSNAVNNGLMKKFEMNGHWANHCGVDIPICKYYVYGVKKDRSREYQMKSVKWVGETLIKSLLGN